MRQNPNGARALEEEMRNAIVVVFAAVATFGPFAVSARDSVNLNRPGALERLKRENPVHYERASGILLAATEMPCHVDEFAKVMRTKFEAKEANCGVMLWTSDPAQRQLSFVLDNTQYVAAVRMKQAEKLVRAK
jgi:hypothetical protein